MKTRIALMSCFLIFVSTAGYARASDPKLKSMGTAIALGLDPIPADALFYANKPVQGGINLILGGTGGFMFWYGLYKYTTYSNPSLGQCSDLSCSDFSNLGNALLMVGGGLLYFPSLLWDGIGGISGVESHNEKVRNRGFSFWRTIQPAVAVTNDGFIAGAQFEF